MMSKNTKVHFFIMKLGVIRLPILKLIGDMQPITSPSLRHIANALLAAD
jgi:hypothetical protein